MKRNLINQNKEDGHTVIFPYDDCLSILDDDPSPYKINLNSKWSFKFIKEIKNMPKDFYKIKFSESFWDEIEVPSSLELNGYGTPNCLKPYNPSKIKISHRVAGILLYRNVFNIPEEWNNRKIFIHFGKVSSKFYVYINGSFAGFSNDSNLPSEFDITSYVSSGENIIAIKAYKYNQNCYSKDENMWVFSGICKDVYVYSEPKIYINDIFARCKFDENYENADLLIDVYIKSYINETPNLKLDIHLIEDESRRVSEPLTTCRFKLNEKNAVLNTKNHIQCPKKWTAETPNLYKIILILKNSSDNIIETKSLKFGFKEVAIQDENILINGVPILIKGINKCDFDTDLGPCITEKKYCEDLEIIKKSNINAVRICNYSGDPVFYELCSEYGIYVLPDTNIEDLTHSSDEIKRMILRDRNNPCLIAWSFICKNNISEETCINIKELINKIDDTKPVCFEGAYDFEASDLILRRYPSIDTLKDIGNHEKVINTMDKSKKIIKTDEYNKRPVIITKYECCIGNSLGNLNEYVNCFSKYNNIAGGFIGNFSDQIIHKKGKHLNSFWLYGKDFNKKFKNSEFCADGLLFADKTPHPALFEVKKDYQYIKARPLDIEKGIFEIQNNYSFSDLSNFLLNFSVSENGKEIQNGIILDININPGEKRKIKIDYNISDIKKDCEYYITLIFKLKNGNIFTDGNFEMAFEQFEIPFGRRKKLNIIDNDSILKINDTEDRIIVFNDNFKIAVGKKSGGIEYLNFGFGNVVYSPLVPNYWRALTDNDIGLKNYSSKIKYNLIDKSWRKSSLFRKVINFDIKNKSTQVVINISQKIKNCAGYVMTRYIIHNAGYIEVNCSLTPLKDMYRIGMQMSLPKNFDRISFFGRGPHENYIDRKLSAKLGIYSGKVKDFLGNYVNPQENANHTDVRWTSLTDEKGMGIKIESSYKNLLNISAWPYSIYDLEQADHIHRLPERDFIMLNIDYMQCGIGNDLSGYPSLKEEYKINKNIKYDYGFIIYKMR